MAVAFSPVYQQQGGPWTYLLAANGAVPSGRPWTGIYITSSFDLSGLTESSIPLDQIIAQFENQQPFNVLVFLHFAASASPNVQQIGAALDSINWGVPQYAGVVTWIAQPGAINQASVDAAPKLPFAPYAPEGAGAVVPSITGIGAYSLLALNPGQPGSQKLFITGGNQVTLRQSDGNDALLLDAPLAIAHGVAGNQPQTVVAAAPSGIQIPVGDTNNGCLVFDGTLAATISDVGIGFVYGVTPDSTAKLTPAPFTYPLLNAVNGLDGRGVSAVLSILAPLDISQCYLSLKPDGGGFATAYRSLLDRVIKLTPLADGSSRLVFNPGFGGVRYLTPHGAFAMSIDGSESSQYGLDHQLLCGLSGVEYINFADNDLLRFYSGQNASVSVHVEPDLPAGANVTYAFDSPAAVQTAWAMVLPGNPGQTKIRQYYSEPDQAPFFTATGVSADSMELGFFGLSLSCLPDAATRPPPPPATAPVINQFPLLPYASFDAGTAFGADPAYAEVFEYQLINPTRRAQIEAMSSTSMQTNTELKTPTITAITPEGYAATFTTPSGQPPASHNKIWTALQVAQMGSDINITFGDPGSSAPLPQPLQEAFLTNQQFLVITSAQNLGAFAPKVDMGDWPFTIDLTKNTPVGDYHNVIIFKSANATVTQLASHPELWTRYADFNDSTHDPDGRFLSNWLVDYLNTAKQLFADGQGVASLANFCALIDDPHWNGFLALRVDIGTQSLPPQIEALLAGIDRSLFVAHHIGNQVNHVTPPAAGSSGYQLNSAVFGLVHYVDPALGSQVNNIPSYIADPQSYDFKVLTLEAVFENAQLVTFGNKSLLTLNQLFGDAVQQTSATGDAGANTLVLVGSYNEKNDPPYTFTTAQGAITNFYLASNALECVEITRATMAVTQPPQHSYLAHFTLSGNFSLMNDPDFDILSYQRLGFVNLGLDMALDSAGANAPFKRSFNFDSTMLRLALAQNMRFDPTASDRVTAGFNLVRQGSLLEQFPLQLSGFVNGDGGRQPAAMGFRTLETTLPKGIDAASLGTDGWYALSFDLNLGGQGALGQNGGLTAQFLLAWAPGGQQGLPDVLPALKIAGPGGVSLSFDIEGVVKFGAADIVLNRLPAAAPQPAQFVLMFESIAFSVLSFSFPPKGSTNVFLFGTTDAQSGQALKPTLGWFGGYVAQPPTSAGP